MDEKVKKHSFMFIPSSGKIKQLSLGTGRIKWVMLTIALFLVLNIGFFVYNIHSTYRLARIQRLELERKEANEKLREIEMKFDSTRQTIEYLASLEKKVRLVAGLEQISDSSGIIGFGGPYLKTRPKESSILNRKTSAVEYALDSLLMQTELQIQSYTELCSTFTRKKDVLDRTPSIKPMKGYLTSVFGTRIDPFTGTVKMHEGIDIVAAKGTPIVATADGIVTFTGWYHGYGKMVKINHKYYETRYGHIDQIKVYRGQRIKRGDIIGTCGRTGRATANHVHYEVRVGGKAQDPMDYIYPADITVN